MKLKVEAILDKGFMPMVLVYREFTDVDTFMKELNDLKGE